MSALSCLYYLSYIKTINTGFYADVFLVTATNFMHRNIPLPQITCIGISLNIQDVKLSVIKYMLWISAMEYLGIVLQYLFLIRVVSVLIIEVFFAFKMHTHVSVSSSRWTPCTDILLPTVNENCTIIGLLLIKWFQLVRCWRKIEI